MRTLKSARYTVSRAIVLVLGLVFLSGTASAQSELPSKITIQGTGLFTTSRDAGPNTQDATNSGGFLLGYSYRLNDWASLESNYGYSQNTHNFSTLSQRTGVRADLHQFTGAFVADLPFRADRLRPYTLAGAGALVFDPTDEVSITGSNRQTRATFVYGGGVEYELTPRIGLRGEYRGYVYGTPDFGVDTLNLDRVTHLAQPAFGIFFRF